MGKREKRSPVSAAATDSSGSQQNMSGLSKGKREYISIKGKSRAIVLVEIHVEGRKVPPTEVRLMQCIEIGEENTRDVKAPIKSASMTDY
jgi:hypothetical protein